MVRVKTEKAGLSQLNKEMAELRERLHTQEKQIAELQRRVLALESGKEDTCPGLADIKNEYACTEPTKVTELIGCLEDCVMEPEVLRKKVRDVRSSDSDH